MVFGTLDRYSTNYMPHQLTISFYYIFKFCFSFLSLTRQLVLNIHNAKFPTNLSFLTQERWHSKAKNKGKLEKY